MCRAGLKTTCPNNNTLTGVPGAVIRKHIGADNAPIRAQSYDIGCAPQKATISYLNFDNWHKNINGAILQIKMNNLHLEKHLGNPKMILFQDLVLLNADSLFLGIQI